MFPLIGLKVDLDLTFIVSVTSTVQKLTCNEFPLAPFFCSELLFSIVPHCRIPFRAQALFIYVACTLRELFFLSADLFFLIWHLAVVISIIKLQRFILYNSSYSEQEGIIYSNKVPSAVHCFMYLDNLIFFSVSFLAICIISIELHT